MDIKPITPLDAAVDYFLATLDLHPERDALAAHAAALDGRKRPYPVLYMNHLYSPDDTTPVRDELILPEVRTASDPLGNLARELVGKLQPLDMLNPVSSSFGLGMGTDTLITCFGVPLDPATGNSRAFTKPLRQVMECPPPDPANSGLLPEIRARIEFLKAHTPPRVKIALPDMQGPFNLVHSLIGEECMLAPYDDEPGFHAVMERMTTLWIEARRNLTRWIGFDRMAPIERHATICECSVNLVSADFYRQFILPHDRRILAAFGPLHIHPCSGPHVFHVTFENLSVAHAEAGYIAKTAAGAISVDDALKAIGARPILLSIGQELPEGREFDFICADLDRYARNPRLLFAYTGMHWRRKDRPLIRDMHRRLDAHWKSRYG